MKEDKRISDILPTNGPAMVQSEISVPSWIYLSVLTGSGNAEFMWDLDNDEDRRDAIESLQKLRQHIDFLLEEAQNVPVNRGEHNDVVFTYTDPIEKTLRENYGVSINDLNQIMIEDELLEDEEE